MSWPMSQDFNEAMQNPRSSFDDPDLKTGETVVGAHGLPLPRSGNFADVYQLRGADGNEWAVKCFTRPVTGLADRYAAISEALAEAHFPFSVGFEFFSEGIRVGGVGRPVLKMEWVEGLLFNQVVRDNAGNPKVLGALGQMWVKLAKRLREAGVAHADLQHGNVLLVPGSRPGAYGLKLIDYDGMYVPALANTPSGESGHPSYQHPLRAKTRAYSPDVDRFPHLVVATALKGLAVCGQSLWEKYDNGDNLLFTEEDFQKPAESKVMRELWLTQDPAVQAFVGRLAIACGRSIPQTPWLDQLVFEIDPTPLDDETRRAAAAAVGLPIPVPVAPLPPPIATPQPIAPPAPLFESFDSPTTQPTPRGEEVDVELVEDPAAGKKRAKTNQYRQNEKSSSKTMFIAGGVLLLVVVVAAAAMMAGGKPKQETAQNKPDEAKEQPKKEPSKRETPPKDTGTKTSTPVPPVNPMPPVEPPVKPKDPLPRTVPIVPLELLDEVYAKVEGFPSITGWRKQGMDMPMVVTNSSDRHAPIPDTKDFQLAPRGVAVHPMQKEFVAVVWKSPFAGKASIAFRVSHLDRGGGNGVAWWIEHRHRERAMVFSEGSLDVGRTFQQGATINGLSKGDQLIFAVDARDELHNNDMTQVAITITEIEQDKPGRVWDLGADVAETIGEGNPHADKHGNKDTWSFVRNGPPSVGGKPKDPPKDPSPQPGELKARWATPVKGARNVNIVRIDDGSNLALLASPAFAALDLTSGQARQGFGRLPKTGAVDAIPLDEGQVGTRVWKADEIIVWDAKMGKELRKISIPEIPPAADVNANAALVYLSPNAKYLAVGRGGDSREPEKR